MTQPGTYVALSGQRALEQRLATIANNVANIGTAGFRAEGVHFETDVSDRARAPTNFVNAGGPWLSTQSGPLNPTGNDLDVAIKGDGWMAFAGKGGTAYTRDGRMQVSPEGELLTLTGHPVLDSGGSPISIDASAGPVTINTDGTIFQQGKAGARLGLFRIDTRAGYTHTDTSGIIPQTPAETLEAGPGQGFAQGFVEGSNANGVTEMTRLIDVTRNFERMQSALDTSDSTQRRAIETLGG